jgi:hypothetical protein
MMDETGPIDGQRIEKLLSGVEASRGPPSSLASGWQKTSVSAMASTD